MNIAVIKIGARIAFSNYSKSAGTGEALSIVKLLCNGGKNNVDVYSHILEGKDDKPTDFNIIESDTNCFNVDSSKYDCLVVVNGNVTFFGGAEKVDFITPPIILNKWKGKVFYFLCDPNLVLKQCWNQMAGKEWSKKWNKDDIYHTREDITYICQANRTDLIKAKAEKALGCKIKDIKHFPFEKFPLYTAEGMMDINPNPEYDLLYGGTFRGGAREKDMIKFYFGYDPEKYNVTMFGNIKEKDFNTKRVDGATPPRFEGKVAYCDFVKKMNNALATVIIGDKEYKEVDEIAQRAYESVLAGTVVFVDEDYDRNKRVFTHDILRKFSYVKDGEEVRQKLERLRDPEFRRKIIEAQRIDVMRNFNKEQYADELCNMLKD